MAFYDNPASYNTGLYSSPQTVSVAVIGIYPHWKVWSDPMQLSTLSTEYVPVYVSCQLAGASYDPTNDLVYMAFVQGNSQPSTWNSAVWAATSQANVYQAQCLVGPDNGGVVLNRGVWNVWLKIDGSPEIPIREAGVLTIN